MVSLKSKPLDRTRKDAKEFSKRWLSVLDNNAPITCELFWTDFLENVLGVVKPLEKVEFHKKRKWQKQHHIKEKNPTVDLCGVSLGLLVSQETPDTTDLKDVAFGKASTYAIFLDYPRSPQHVIASNYRTMCLLDIFGPANQLPVIVQLETLAEQIQQFDFIRKSKAAHVPWSLLHYQN